MLQPVPDQVRDGAEGVVLKYFEQFERVDEAIPLERQIKVWSVAKKEALIAGEYGALPGLARRGAGKIA